MRKRYAMAVDTVRCVGCNGCVIACKTENALPSGGFRDWIAEETRGAFPALLAADPLRALQPVQPPVLRGACPTGASHVAEGGVVGVTRAKCTGCKACIAACPYGARYVHPEGFVDKCTFCLHRVIAGKAPACVETCPTRALDLRRPRRSHEPASRAHPSRRFTVLQPGSGNAPNVFFLS